MRVGVVGAGIGGLTTALALVRAGIDVDVFEQRADLPPTGAGLSLSPNATRILHHLELQESLRRVSVAADETILRRWDSGTYLGTYTLSDGKHGGPTYLLHRRDLLHVLFEALPAGIVHFGRGCIRVIQNAQYAEIEFDTGAVTVDAIIGADGLHSTVRRAVTDTSPRFAGLVAYRGLIPAARMADLGMQPNVVSWIGRGKFFLHYPAGPHFLNVVHDVPHEEPLPVAPTSGFGGDFTNWHPIVRDIARRVESPWQMALYDLEPLRTWTTGRVALLGDAAHPVAHFVAQGAAFAIEDAVVIARCLADANASDVSEAFRRFERLRKPRATRCQMLSYMMRRRLLSGESNSISSDARSASFDWLYSYDAYTHDIAEENA